MYNSTTQHYAVFGSSLYSEFYTVSLIGQFTIPVYDTFIIIISFFVFLSG